jgi:hypothetical protein
MSSFALTDPNNFFRQNATIAPQSVDATCCPVPSGFRAATLHAFGALVADIEGVHLHQLPPFTTLLVRTMNSLYRVFITPGPEVYVQGGAFFPDPTAAYIDGASIGGSCIRVCWIGIGLLVVIRSGGRRIITSPVRAIATEKGWRSCSASWQGQFQGQSWEQHGSP